MKKVKFTTNWLVKEKFSKLYNELNILVVTSNVRLTEEDIKKTILKNGYSLEEYHRACNSVV